MQQGRGADNSAGYKLGLANKYKEGEENNEELQRACSLLPTMLASIDEPAVGNSSSASYLQPTSSRELLQTLKKRSLPCLLRPSIERSKRTAVFLA
jgi:hypothetical protein